MADELTQEERDFNQLIRDTYNHGDCKRAVELSVDFFTRFPNSRLARYNYAVMHGDYAFDVTHSAIEKERLLKIAKEGLESLLSDPAFSKWPIEFQSGLRNEYYWFFEMHQEQYELGIERLAAGGNGHYSACVGASMMALKCVRRTDIQEAERWAKVALEHFREFEKIAPDWYNINYFASQALACLGRYDEAVTCFKDMYRKQRSDEKPQEVADFLKTADEIRAARASAVRAP